MLNLHTGGVSGAVIRGRVGRAIHGPWHRGKSKEKQLVITETELTMSQGTLEEKYDYHHSTESSKA